MTKTYQTRQGDMWDSIAFELYGSELGAAKLLQANPRHADIVVLPAGLTLTVPDYKAPKISLLPPWRRS